MTGSEADAVDAAPLAGRTAVVVTCSTRAAAGVYPDRGGALLVETLRAWGASVADAGGRAGRAGGGPCDRVGPRHPARRPAHHRGHRPDPHRPHTRGHPAVPHPRGARASRRRSGRAGVAHGIPTAVLSRGLAGLAGRTLVVNLPGSTGGVRDALEVLAEVLPHALSQAQGGDH